MKKILWIFVLVLLISNNVETAILEEKSNKLNKVKKVKFQINVFRKSKGGTIFDRMEILFDDFRLYTHRAWLPSIALPDNW